MDIKSVTKDYVECASGGSVTAPNNGSWISAYAIALGATEIENGSWLQTLCEQLGITQPVNSSWVIALANYYGISQPVNGSWWYAIADEACNGVPSFTGLLDDYPGATAAYSIRQLRGGYTGSAFRVRRDSDDAEQDIGFDVNGDLDTAALETFCSGTDGFVVTWYDQILGTPNNFVASKESGEPKVCSNGVTVTENGEPALEYAFPGAQFESTYEISSDANIYINMVFKMDTFTDFNPRFFGSVSNTVNLQIGTNTSNRYFLRNSNTSTNTVANFTVTGTQNILTFGTSSGTPYFQRDGVSDAFNITGAPGANSLRTNGSYFTQGYSTFDEFAAASGTVQEIVIYETDQSSNVSGIFTNVNTYYDVVPDFTGLLDTYSGAEVAYSASRRLSNTYTGPLVKVVKSGSAATDIGYDATTNELDTTALQTYAGSDTVYVEKWYDQTGNGHHAEQTLSTRQPIIVTNGTIETLNSKVAIKFDGADDYMPLISNVQSDVYGLGTFTFNRIQGTTQVALGDEQDNIYPVYPFSNNIAYANLGAGGNGIGTTVSGHSGITLRLFDDTPNAGPVNKLEGWINNTFNAGSGQSGPGDPTKAFDAYGTRQLTQYTGNLHNEFVFWRGEQTNTFSNGVHNNLGTYYGTGTV